MPAAYEAMRDAFVKKGMPLKRAKAKAARIFNAKAKPGQEIVSPHEGARKKRRPHEVMYRKNASDN